MTTSEYKGIREILRKTAREDSERLRQLRQRTRQVVQSARELRSELRKYLAAAATFAVPEYPRRTDLENAISSKESLLGILCSTRSNGKGLARSHHLVSAFFRGKPYSACEKKCNADPDFWEVLHLLAAVGAISNDAEWHKRLEIWQKGGSAYPFYVREPAVTEHPVAAV